MAIRDFGNTEHKGNPLREKVVHINKTWQKEIVWNHWKYTSLCLVRYPFFPVIRTKVEIFKMYLKKALVFKEEFSSSLGGHGAFS